MEYFDKARQLIDTIEQSEQGKIGKVAELMADCIIKDGIPHIFGSGHSSIPAKEVFIRAGTLSCLRAIALDEDLDRYERIEGVASAVLSKYELLPNDMLIVISNSGINPLPIEIAQIGKEKCLPVVALCSLSHSLSQKSRHSSQKRLVDIADITIDTHVPEGDASMKIPSLPMKIGPLSTLAGVVIMNAIVVETIFKIIARGEEPPVRISRNMPGGDEHNERFRKRYGSRIPEL